MAGVRSATLADLDSYLDLFEEVVAENRWLGTEPPVNRVDLADRCRRCISSKRAEVLVATDGQGRPERVIGALSVELEPYGVAHLGGMVVAANHRGRGLGRRLLKEAISWASRAGAHKVALETWPENEGALRLYRSFGFVEEGTLRLHYRRRSGELKSAVIMGLLLGERVLADSVPVVALSGVGVTRHGRDLLDGVSFTVGVGERWVVLGPNGSGKTTLLRVAGGQLRPTRGIVDLLGHRLGKVDVRTLWPRVGFASQATDRALRDSLTAQEVVMTGKNAALEPWWHRYDEQDRTRARKLLSDAGLAHLSEQMLGVLSQGERQRVQLARILMGNPEVIFMDEPAAGLDFGARERLITQLGNLAQDTSAPALVLITHHLEEIPLGATHVLLLRDGRVLSAGPIASTLTSAALSDCFGMEVIVHADKGRWWAVASSATIKVPR